MFDPWFDFFEHGDIQCDIQRGFFEFHFLQGIWETNEGSEISGTFLGAPKSGIRAEQDTVAQDDGGNTRWQVEATRITPTICECEWTGLTFEACLTKCYMFYMGSPWHKSGHLQTEWNDEWSWKKRDSFWLFSRSRLGCLFGYHTPEISLYNRLKIYLLFSWPSIKCWPSHLSHSFKGNG